MPAPRHAARLWTGKVLPSTADGSARPKPKADRWKTGDRSVDQRRAMARLHAHAYTTNDPGAPCDLCGSHVMEKVAGKLIHPDPRPVRPQPAWEPPRPTPMVDPPPKPRKKPKPKKKQPTKAQRDAADIAAQRARSAELARQRELEKLARKAKPLGPFIDFQGNRAVDLDKPTPVEASGRLLVPASDYEGEWVSADLRFMVERMTVRLGNGQHAERYSVTDLKYQRGTKKNTLTVRTFEDAQDLVKIIT